MIKNDFSRLNTARKVIVRDLYRYGNIFYGARF
jgi:hypothetical protein